MIFLMIFSMKILIFSMKIMIFSMKILIFSMKILDFLYEKSWWHGRQKPSVLVPKNRQGNWENFDSGSYLLGS